VVEVITTTIILAIPLQLGEDNSQTKALIIMPQMAQAANDQMHHDKQMVINHIKTETLLQKTRVI
jgi:hypothetical protein